MSSAATQKRNSIGKSWRKGRQAYRLTARYQQIILSNNCHLAYSFVNTRKNNLLHGHRITTEFQTSCFCVHRSIWYLGVVPWLRRLPPGFCLRPFYGKIVVDKVAKEQVFLFGFIPPMLPTHLRLNVVLTGRGKPGNFPQFALFRKSRRNGQKALSWSYIGVTFSHLLIKKLVVNITSLTSFEAYNAPE